MFLKSLLIVALANIATAHVRPYKIEFVLSARDLSAQNSSAPASYAVVSHAYKSAIQTPFAEIGKTQFINNKGNPDWLEVFRFSVFYPTDYSFAIQTVKVEVFSHNPKTDDEYIGMTLFHPDEILHQFGNRLKLTLYRRDGKPAGELVVRGREYGSTDANIDDRFSNPKKVFNFPAMA